MPLGPMDAASQSPVACSIHGFGLGWMNGRQIARAQHPDLAASPSHTFASIYFHLALSLVRSIDRSLALTPHRYLLASLRINISLEDIELFTKKKGGGRIHKEIAVLYKYKQITVITLYLVNSLHFNPELIIRVYYTLWLP
jgi:hypothetical protein